MRRTGSVRDGVRLLLRVGGVACVVLLVLHLAGRTRAMAAHTASDVAGHMTMTALRPAQAGDTERADAILVSARAVASQYTDFHKALADGYVIFHPEWRQNVYHFTDNQHALRNTLRFDASRPTSLLYERVPAKDPEGDPGYKLVGVMYTAPFQATEEELNSRVPLSVARWHLHTNLCMPPEGEWVGLTGDHPKFGLAGSITTAEACAAAGGRFLPHVFGWMVHVYPFETDPAKVWSSGMEDRHGMEHDAMPMGMKM